MHSTMLIVHFIGLAMGVGTGFAFMALGRKAAKLPADKQREFILNSAGLGRVGQIGLVLLVLSGGYLATPYWGSLGAMPLFIAKLALVLVLAAVVGINSALVRKARNGAELQMAKMARLGGISMAVSITIVVLAVLIFG